MGGSKEQESTTESSPWAPAQGHLTGALGQAENLFNQLGGINASSPDRVAAGLNPYLSDAYGSLASSGALNQMAGYFGDIGAAGMKQGWEQLQQASKGPSTYDIQSLRDTYLGDKQAFLDSQNTATLDALNKNIATSTGGIYGQAAGGGNVGSSRTQLSVGQAAGDLAAAANAQMADRSSAAYDQAMSQATQQLGAQQQAAMQAGQQMMGMGFQGLQGATNASQQALQNMLIAGQGQQQYDQFANDVQWQNLLQQQQAGWNNLNQYANLGMGIGGMGGTSTTTQKGPGFDWGNAMVGLGSAWLMSDRRLKTDIQKVMHNDTYGLDVYTWSWIPEIQEMFKDGELDEEAWNRNRLGFIAQEVQELYPEAVKEVDGFLMVSYARLAEMRSSMEA